MSDLIEKLIGEVDKGGGIISGLRQRLADADRKRKVNQLKQQIQDLRLQETQSINALSAQVMALHEARTLSQPELVSLCQGVDNVRAQIKDLETELEKLQPPPPIPAAESRCPRCGSVLAAGAMFCQTCGSRIEAAPEPSPMPVAPDRCKCGATVVAGAIFCQACGARLVAESSPALAPVLFCAHCGANLREGAIFCPACGKAVDKS
ncbi:MAG: zinc ribbon domain-containing protein [Anaerolineae bacterium]|nr:zinc ribbon domain-containing protein [Anaerolineae bacterium]